MVQGKMLFLRVFCIIIMIGCLVMEGSLFVIKGEIAAKIIFSIVIILFISVLIYIIIKSFSVY